MKNVKSAKVMLIMLASNDEWHKMMLPWGYSLRHGRQIQPQLSAASLTNRPQPKVLIAIVIIKLKLWPAACCEAKVVAELSLRPLPS